MKAELAPISAIHMEVTIKSFDLFEREMIKDIVITRIPFEWTAAEIFWWCVNRNYFLSRNSEEEAMEDARERYKRRLDDIGTGFEQPDETEEKERRIGGDALKLDDEAICKRNSYIELNYGRSYLTPLEQELRAERRYSAKILLISEIYGNFLM